MTDLNPKGLEAAVAQFLTDGGYSFGEPDLSPLSYHSTRIGRAIRAYIAASPTQPVEAEAVAWEGYWPGAGSIDSVTRLTRSRFVMERWIGEGAEITPLYEAPPTVSALEARALELAGALNKIRETLPSVMRALLALGGRDNVLLAGRVHNADAAALAAIVSHNPPEMRDNAPCVQQDGSKR